MSHYPAEVEAPLQETDSFTNELLLAVWARGDQDVPTALSPRSKAIQGSNASDTELRRDRDLSSELGLTGSQAQLQLQLGGSSGHGSEAAGSVHHHEGGEGSQQPAKRGRGRQRKSTGVETAQQRAHRRFYERKKQRMAGLEQEAREKQAEYQQLLAINAELRRKHEALERAVAGRDEHMVLVQALGSLSLAAAGRQQPTLQQPLLAMQPVHLQQAGPPSQRHQQHNVQATQQPEHRHAGHSEARQRDGVVQPQSAAANSSWPAPSAGQPAAVRPSVQQLQQQLHRQQHQQQQRQPSADLMPEVEAAGPFGLVQLPQFGEDDDAELPLGPEAPPAAATAQKTVMPAKQQQQQALRQYVPWIQPLQLPEQPLLGGGFEPLTSPGLMLTRSSSMPARTGGFDTIMSPGTGTFGGAYGSLTGLPGGPQMSRSFSSTPTGWHSRMGSIRAAAAAAAAGEWTGFGLADAAEGGSQQQQGLALLPGGSRSHSWSGPTAMHGAGVLPAGILPKASSTFGPGPVGALQQAAGQATLSGMPDRLPVIPKLSGGLDFASAVNAAAAAAAGAGGHVPVAIPSWLQQQQQPEQAAATEQRAGQWHTITTLGPLASTAPRQQQLEQVQRPTMPRMGSDPSLITYHEQQQQLMAWQQQQQQPQLWQGPAPGDGFMASGIALQELMPDMRQQAQALLQAPAPGTAAALQPQQQLAQRLGDIMALEGPPHIGCPPVDDFAPLDDDLMEMLERLSQQQSVEMLSPLPSIPSALLTGDSLRQSLEQLQAAPAAAAAQQHPPAATAATAAAPSQQQQQQDPQQLPSPVTPEAMAGSNTAAGGGGSGTSSPPSTLLEASRQLQARHQAAGFCPPATSPNEMFYLHELVDWYKGKLQQLHELLPHVDRPQPDVSAGVALVRAMEEVIDGTRKFATRNRIGMWELKLINLETGEFEEASASHWQAVADRIHLPPHMRESALACYGLYLEYVDKLRAERQAIQSDLQALEEQLGAAAAAAGLDPQQLYQQQQQLQAPPTLQFRFDGYEEYQSLLERLQMSLRREHMITNMLSYSLGQIASHVQMAKGMLACWPFWPDGPSVLSVWREQEQQQQQLRTQPGLGANARAGMHAGAPGAVGGAAAAAGSGAGPSRLGVTPDNM